MHRQTHSVTSAVLLSLLIPGGGQYYNGQGTKSALIILSFPALPALCWLLTWLLHEQPLSVLLIFVPFVALPLVWFIQLMDAGFVAGRIQHGEPVKQWDWF